MDRVGAGNRAVARERVEREKNMWPKRVVVGKYLSRGCGNKLCGKIFVEKE